VCPTRPVKALIMGDEYERGSDSRAGQVLSVDELYEGR
jgi:hypothetical protein